jgi:hypothetical protein
MRRVALSELVSITSSSHDPNHPPSAIFDNQMSSFWTTTGSYPQEVACRFKKDVSISRIMLKCRNVTSFFVEAGAEMKKVCSQTTADALSVDSSDLGPSFSAPPSSDDFATLGTPPSLDDFGAPPSLDDFPAIDAPPTTNAPSTIDGGPGIDSAASDYFGSRLDEDRKFFEGAFSSFPKTEPDSPPGSPRKPIALEIFEEAFSSPVVTNELRFVIASAVDDFCAVSSLGIWIVDSPDEPDSTPKSTSAHVQTPRTAQNKGWLYDKVRQQRTKEPDEERRERPTEVPGRNGSVQIAPLALERLGKGDDEKQGEEKEVSGEEETEEGEEEGEEPEKEKALTARLNTTRSSLEDRWRQNRNRKGKTPR